jgi:nicotinamidase-related amidase
MRTAKPWFGALLAASLPLFAVAEGGGASEPPARPTTALVVVDAQVGVLSSLWQSSRVVANIEVLVRAARQAGVPVVWVQHADEEELKYGSDAWKLAPNFVPTASEVVIHKRYNSSFANTDLDQRLKAGGINRMVLAGAATNWCVRSTAYAALDRGYDLVLVSDAHSTQSMEFPDGRTVSAESIITELNTVMRWVSAPNVRTEVKMTSELVF